jgi:hypothetical protein
VLSLRRACERNLALIASDTSKELNEWKNLEEVSSSTPVDVAWETL